MDKYEIGNEFVEGMCAALSVASYDEKKSAHWKAGYDAGCSMKGERHRLMNEYLASIGQETMAMFKII